MSKWINLEHQLPKPYKDVLLYIPCNWGSAFDEGCMCVGSFDRKNNCFLLNSVNGMQDLSDYINDKECFNNKKPIQLINFPSCDLCRINFEPSHWHPLPRKPFIHLKYVPSKKFTNSLYKKDNFISKFLNKLRNIFNEKNTL